MKIFNLFAISCFSIITGLSTASMAEEKIDFDLKNLQTVLADVGVQKAVGSINEAGHDGYTLKAVIFSGTGGAQNEKKEMVYTSTFTFKFDHNYYIGKKCELAVQLRQNVIIETTEVKVGQVQCSKEELTR